MPRLPPRLPPRPDCYPPDIAVFLDDHGEGHHLLESPPPPRYPDNVVRRAYIAWVHLGREQSFNVMCSYYNTLNDLENTYTHEVARYSRSLEYNLIERQPPSSEFLKHNFPRLYPMTEDREGAIVANRLQIAELRTLENVNYVQAEDILPASNLITNYLRNKHLTVDTFLRNFRQFALDEGVQPTLNTAVSYITSQMNLDSDEGYCASADVINSELDHSQAKHDATMRELSLAENVNVQQNQNTQGTTGGGNQAASYSNQAARHGNQQAGISNEAAGYSNEAPYYSEAPGFMGADYSNDVANYINEAADYSNVAAIYNNVAPSYMHALNYSNDQVGYGIEAASYSNEPVDYSNLAAGYNNEAENHSSEVIDYSNLATGYNNEAVNYSSEAIGYSNVAADYTNVAVDYSNQLPGYGNWAPGYSNTAFDYSTVAAGFSNQAPGYSNEAADYNNPAPGYSNEAARYSNQRAGPSNESTVYNNQASRYSNKKANKNNQAAGCYQGSERNQTSNKQATNKQSTHVYNVQNQNYSNSNPVRPTRKKTYNHNHYNVVNPNNLAGPALYMYPRGRGHTYYINPQYISPQHHHTNTGLIYNRPHMVYPCYYPQVPNIINNPNQNPTRQLAPTNNSPVKKPAKTYDSNNASNFNKSPVKYGGQQTNITSPRYNQAAQQKSITKTKHSPNKQNQQKAWQGAQPISNINSSSPSQATQQKPNTNDTFSPNKQGQQISINCPQSNQAAQQNPIANIINQEQRLESEEMLKANVPLKTQLQQKSTRPNEGDEQKPIANVNSPPHDEAAQNPDVNNSTNMQLLQEISEQSTQSGAPDVNACDENAHSEAPKENECDDVNCQNVADKKFKSSKKKLYWFYPEAQKHIKNNPNYNIHRYNKGPRTPKPSTSGEIGIQNVNPTLFTFGDFENNSIFNITASNPYHNKNQ